jgi:hypothetical protein
MAMNATDVDVESDAFKTDAESGAERMGWMRAYAPTSADHTPRNGSKFVNQRA